MTPDKLDDDLAQAVEQIRKSPIPTGPSDELMRDTLEKLALAVPAAAEKTKPERMIFMKTITKLAIAAVILFVAFTGWNWIDRSGTSGIVLADVVQRVQQAGVIFYRMQATTTGEPLPGTQGNAGMNIEGNIWISKDFGMKMEMKTTVNNVPTTTIMYMNPNEKRAFQVLPDMKKYMELEFSEELIKREQNQDPREWIQKLGNSSQMTSLGRSEINGITVEGFESTDPAMAGGVAENVRVKLWVDVKTGYPIQMDMTMDMNEGRTQMQTTIFDFQWNAVVDASIFEPKIEADYTALPKMTMPKMDQEAAINGLRKYVELTEKYPDSLNLTTLMDGLQKVMASGKGMDPNQFKGLSQDEIIKKSMDMMMPFQSMGMFYMTLVQDKKDPAYYGKMVTPGDSQAVLLRWKASDTTYKVIMGDLSTVEMTAEQLKQIEPQIQPQQ